MSDLINCISTGKRSGFGPKGAQIQLPLVDANFFYEKGDIERFSEYVEPEKKEIGEGDKKEKANQKEVSKNKK